MHRFVLVLNVVHIYIVLIYGQTIKSSLTQKYVLNITMFSGSMFATNNEFESLIRSKTSKTSGK